MKVIMRKFLWPENGCSLRKQPTFGDPAMPLVSPPNDVWETSAEIPWRLYPDLGSSSDWLNQISHSVRPIRITTRFWVVTRHHYGISELVFQTFFRGETSGGVVECRLFSQASLKNDIFWTKVGSGFGEFPGILPGKIKCSSQRGMGITWFFKIFPIFRFLFIVIQSTVRLIESKIKGVKKGRDQL